MIENKLSIRRFRISDHKEYRRARSESELNVSKYFEIGPLMKTSLRKSSYELIHRLSGPEKYGHFAVFFEKTFVGHFSLYQGTFANSLQINYWIRTGYQNLGIATWALTKISNNLLDLEGVFLVELLIDETNVASLKVASKSGFIRKPLSEAPSNLVEGLDPKFGWFVRGRCESIPITISNSIYTPYLSLKNI
jgi:RimJ/RimL family protein N-acetyltransferase